MAVEHGVARHAIGARGTLKALRTIAPRAMNRRSFANVDAKEEAKERNDGANARRGAGAVYHVASNGRETTENALGRGDARPVMRVGAEAQTLPPPNEKLVTRRKMEKVEFERASADVRDAPPSDGLPEIALIGRSNVGKSSLLNLMTFNAGNAVVSATPGTTVRMNHYLVDKKWRLVDLPGYGYAEADRDTIAAWDAFTKDYFVKRETLAGVLLLVDASLPPTKNDEEYANWLIENETPFTIVFTKCDRNKPGSPSVEDNKAALRRKLDEKWRRLPSMISTSSVTAEGREEVLKFVSSLIMFRRMRAEERRKAKRREKQRLVQDEKYEAKGRALGRAPTKRPTSEKMSKVLTRASAPAKESDEWDADNDDDDFDDDDDDDDGSSSFAMKSKGKGQKSMQDMIKAELQEMRREKSKL